MLHAAALLALLATGCGSAGAPVAGPPPPAASDPGTGLRLPDAPSDGGRAQFHVLSGDGDQLDLDPWSACLGGGCFDGFPDDEHLPGVGSPASVTFGFDRAGWDFEDVTFRELGVACPRHVTVAATRLGARTFRIDPAGPAGTWAVDVFGRGPDGDAVTTFRWRTPEAGQLPAGASGTAAVLADHDGRLDSYGVEVLLDDLDRRYSPDSATVQVTDADGDVVELAVPRSPSGARCRSEGELGFVAGDDVGRRATVLGPGPFTYNVSVRLGATTYTGTGLWPEGETEELAPHVPLTWEPPLPAYTG